MEFNECNKCNWIGRDDELISKNIPNGSILTCPVCGNSEFVKKPIKTFEPLKKYKLLKDLPGCSVGRIFKENIHGDYYLYLSDDEFLTNEIEFYQFKKQTIINNPDWFELI